MGYRIPQPNVAVSLGTMAIFIFFTKVICAYVLINLVLDYLMIMLAYVIIRELVEMDYREARKVLMVNVGCGLIILVTIWIGFKMIAYSLSGFVR